MCEQTSSKLIFALDNTQCWSRTRFNKGRLGPPQQRHSTRTQMQQQKIPRRASVLSVCINFLTSRETKHAAGRAVAVVLEFIKSRQSQGRRRAAHRRLKWVKLEYLISEMVLVRHASIRTSGQGKGWNFSVTAHAELKLAVSSMTDHSAL